MRKRRATIAVSATVIALASAPAIAQATDRYVDNNGMGASPCTNAANPCSAIATALSVPSVPGDVVHVGGGTYAGNLTLPNGVSLIKDSFVSPFVTSGTVTIGAPATLLPAIAVATGTSARTIDGFTLRGGNTLGDAVSTLSVPGDGTNLTISGNTFDDASTSVDGQLLVGVNGSGGSPQVTGNTFIGVDDDKTRTAIKYLGAGSPEIDHNTITTFYQGVRADGYPLASFTTPKIHDNTITDVYEAGAAIPSGITVNAGSGQIVANLIVGKAGQPGGFGIYVSAAAGPTGTSLRFERNQVYGFSPGGQGVDVATKDPVSFSGDVLANNGTELALFNAPAGVTASGLTATNSNPMFGYDVYASDTPLTLNSSIVGAKGVTVTGTGSCTSSFSRGPSVPEDCGFATAADPMFADPSPAANDFHLLAGSPMIDAGDPADPPAGTLDLDGDPRVVDGDGVCPPRRDIGADELVPAAATDCTAPNTTIKGKKKPKARKRRKRVSFKLGSTEPGSSFECSLDGAPFSPCASPFSRKVRRGAHTLRVRSTDANGNVDPTPAAFHFKLRKQKLKKKH